jgi:hypothetical protein
MPAGKQSTTTWWLGLIRDGPHRHGRKGQRQHDRVRSLAITDAGRKASKVNRGAVIIRRPRELWRNLASSWPVTSGTSSPSRHRGARQRPLQWFLNFDGEAASRQENRGVTSGCVIKTLQMILSARPTQFWNKDTAKLSRQVSEIVDG